jgi:DNA-binding MarR family transcriptional regulator
MSCACGAKRLAVEPQCPTFPGKDDRRAINVFITPAGLEALHSARAVHHRGIQEHFLEQLTQSDVAALARTLEKVRDHVRPLRPGRMSG